MRQVHPLLQVPKYSESRVLVTSCLCTNREAVIASTGRCLVSLEWVGKAEIDTGSEEGCDLLISSVQYSRSAVKTSCIARSLAGPTTMHLHSSPCSITKEGLP